MLRPHIVMSSAHPERSSREVPDRAPMTKRQERQKNQAMDSQPHLVLFILAQAKERAPGTWERSAATYRW